MLNLSLSEISRGGARGRWTVPVDHELWDDTGLRLRSPVEVEAEAQSMNEGVLVRGRLRASVEAECRRCLTDVAHQVDEPLDLLFEPLGEEEAAELGGEVYPLPARGDTLDLGAAIREVLLLHAPQFAVCRDECRGLCPQCGADLNEAACECAPAGEPSPWDALKKIKFD